MKAIQGIHLPFKAFYLLFMLIIYISFAEVNACQPNPCKNGGKCEDVDGVPVCTCVFPYVGQFCECKSYFVA